MHMEHSPLWNTHFLQGGCLCQRYTACTQTHSPRLPAASAAQIPLPPRCVRRTHTHHTPSRLSIGSAEKHKRQKRHLWYWTCWAFDLLHGKSRYEGSLWAQAPQVKIHWFPQLRDSSPASLTTQPERAGYLETAGSLKAWDRSKMTNPFCPRSFCLLTPLTLLALIAVYPHEQSHQTETCTLPTPSESRCTPLAGSHHKLRGLEHPPHPTEEEISAQSPKKWTPSNTGKLWKNWGQKGDFQTHPFGCLPTF